MSKENEKKVPVETEFVEEKKDEKVVELKTEEPKKEEKPKKEFFLIRGCKAIGRGIKKGVDAVGNAIDSHPRIAATLSAMAGAGIMYGVTKIIGGDDSDISEIPGAAMELASPEALPEPDELPEDDYDYSVPDEEPTEVTE